MEHLEIIATNTTPMVLLNPNGTIEIIGKCIPENSAEFWLIIHEWMADYVKDPANQSIVILQIDYLNTSSSKELLNFLYKLNDLPSNKTAMIKWQYYSEDADMKDVGEDYKHMIKIPFEISEIKLEQIS